MRCIYCIISPIDNSIFYIGQTSDFEKRKKSHLSFSTNKKVRDRIHAIVGNGLMPIFKELQYVQVSEINRVEAEYIKRYSATCQLLNARSEQIGDVCRRKTKWSFHEWEVGQEKTMLRHELPLFRSALSVYNNKEGNQRIEYNHEVTVQKAIVKRIA